MEGELHNNEEIIGVSINLDMLNHRALGLNMEKVMIISMRRITWSMRMMWSLMIWVVGMEKEQDMIFLDPIIEGMGL